MTVNKSSAGTILTIALVTLTLIAFAANSLLCRAAFVSYHVNPLEFTAIRLLSGALILAPVLFSGSFWRGSPNAQMNDRARGDSAGWQRFAPAMLLFSYAVTFSLAYVHLQAGTGALILFAAVQLTMMGGSLWLGHHISVNEWFGFTIAAGGLVYLLFPGLSAPPVGGTVLMLAAGVSWGLYSLLGQGRKNPVATTARNFLYCWPGVILLIVLALWKRTETHALDLNSTGLILAILSGAVASGLGYALWYLSLRRISSVTASIVQLAVPVIAGLGGILFLEEHLTVRLVIAAVLIVGGIVVATTSRQRN